MVLVSFARTRHIQHHRDTAARGSAPQQLSPPSSPCGLWPSQATQPPVHPESSGFHHELCRGLAVALFNTPFHKPSHQNEPGHSRQGSNKPPGCALLLLPLTEAICCNTPQDHFSPNFHPRAHSNGEPVGFGGMDQSCPEPPSCWKSSVFYLEIICCFACLSTILTSSHKHIKKVSAVWHQVKFVHDAVPCIA